MGIPGQTPRSGRKQRKYLVVLPYPYFLFGPYLSVDLMTVVYIAHPIGGDQWGNLLKLSDIIRYLNKKYDYIVPFLPYASDVMALDDANPEERERGLKNCRYILEHMEINQLWVCGPVSPGIQMEIDIAVDRAIPVKHHPDMHQRALDYLRYEQPDWYLP